MGEFKLKMGLREGGLSLVEVLATLVILGIVFITFFSFFTQSATFTKHNKEKLTAVQVAEDVVASVRNGAYKVNSDFIKGDYKVTIVIENGPVNLKLKKAVITVKSLSKVGIKGSAFTTEMYFEGG